MGHAGSDFRWGATYGTAAAAVDTSPKLPGGVTGGGGLEYRHGFWSTGTIVEGPPGPQVMLPIKNPPFSETIWFRNDRFGPRSRLSVEGESTSGSCSTSRNNHIDRFVRGAGENGEPWLSH